MRFITLAWSTSDQAQADCAQSLAHRLLAGHRWTCPVRQDGFNIFYFDTRPATGATLVLDEQAGVVLGTLFQGQERKIRFTPDENAEILATQGRWLVGNLWGRYLFFLRDPLSKHIYVLRDPSGGVRCLRTRHRGLHLFFSCMTDCADLGLQDFTVDWNYLRTLIVTPGIQSRNTALEAVTEVQHGECIQIANDIPSSSWYWHPFKVAQSQPIDTAKAAAAALRAATLQAVHAWCNQHATIVHKLSGGLDSSIVAACLACAPSRPEIVAINHYSPGPQSDERPFARQVARHMGFPLVEQPLEDHYRLSSVHLSERPGFYLASHRSILRFAVSVGATAIFDGNGGDQVFMEGFGQYAAADYLALYGPHPELLNIAWDGALQKNITIWEVLGKALMHKIFRPAINPLTEAHKQSELIAREVIDSVSRENAFLHPWYESCEYIPPGLWWHIYTLSISAGVDDPLREPGDPELVSPLLSQHLIETALRIPTHLHAAGGWDRAMARCAFADLLPPDIIKRHVKGGIEQPLGEVIARHLAEIRETLTQGELMRRGFLKRDEIEKSLSGRPSDVSPLNAKLFRLYSVELWLAQWRSVSRRVAA